MRSLISSPARRRLLGFGVPLALAAIAAPLTLGWLHAHRAAGPQINEPSTHAAGPVLTLPHPIARAVPGDVVENVLTIDSTFSLAKSGATSALGSARTRGTLVERTLQATSTGLVSLVSVEGAEVTLGAARQADMEAALAAGIVVERDARGTMTRVRLPKGATGNGMRVLRTVADIGQWTSEVSPTWDAQESTSQGAIHVQYTREDAQHVRKRIDHLASPDGRADLNGSLLATWDADGARITNLHGEETLTLRDSHSVAHHQVALDRVRAGTDFARAAILSASLDDAFFPWAPVDAPLPRIEEDSAARLARIVAGRSLSDIDTLLARAGDDSARHEAIRALRAYALLHPDQCATIAHQAAALDPEDREADARIRALVQAGSPEAQHALFEVARSWRDSQNGVAVVAALGTVDAPTKETADGLRALRDEDRAPPLMARNADVALGNIANKMRDSDPTSSDAIAADLGDRLTNATDPADVSSTLVALGNSGSQRARDLASKYLDDGDPQVRRMAVFAFGRTADDDARATLKHIAETDPDQGVRDEATRMLGST